MPHLLLSQFWPNFKGRSQIFFYLTLSMAGGCQFDTTFSDISRTFKRVHVQFWNFLTFPKYQKQKFWKNFNSNFFYPALKKRKNFKLVLQPKLLNMISYKQKDKKKSKRWALYLKNWPSYGYFCESTQSEISISSNFQIMKSHPVFEISTWNFSCVPNFDRGLTSK